MLNHTLKMLLKKNLNEGTSHWFNQRVSSVILIPITVLFIVTFIQNVGLGYEKNMNFYKMVLFSQKYSKLNNREKTPQNVT